MRWPLVARKTNALISRTAKSCGAMDSPMRNCASEVRAFGASRNDESRLFEN